MDDPFDLEDGPPEVLGFRAGFFNKALREARLGAGLTQKQLAELVRERLGKFRIQAIGRYETLRDFPKPEVQEAIAGILGGLVSELFPAWLSLFIQRRAIQEIPPVVYLSALHPVERLALLANNPDAVIDVAEVGEGAELIKEVHRALEELTSGDRSLLEQRFGIGGRPKRTLDEIAAELGVTRESIRQRETKALRRLRHPRVARRLVAFLDQNL